VKHPFAFSLPRCKAALAALLTSLLYISFAFLSYPSLEDDSFIYYRYIENYFEGSILSFNIGENPTQGVSGLLYTFLLVLARLIFSLNPVSASMLIAFLVVWFFFYLFYNYLLNSTSELSVKISCFLISFIVMIDPSNLIWFKSGMETSLYAFLLVVPFFFSLVWSNWMARFIFFLLLSGSRPEGFLITSVLSLCFALSDCSRLGLASKFNKFSHILRFFSSALPSLIANAICAMAASAIVFITQRIIFGSFLPNTVAAKSGSIVAGLSLGLDYMNNFLSSGFYAYVYFATLALLCIGYIFLLSEVIDFPSIKFRSNVQFFSWALNNSNYSQFYLFFTLLISFVFSIITGGDGLQSFRFYSHSTFVVICATTKAIESFFSNALATRSGLNNSAKKRTAFSVAAFLGLLALSLIISAQSAWKQMKYSLSYWYEGIEYSRVLSGLIRSIPSLEFPPIHSRITDFRMGRKEERSELGIFLDAYLPKHSSVALSPAGKIPYYLGPRTVIDLLGLNDRFIALNNLNANASRYVGGHGVYNDDYVISRNPDYVIMGSVYESDFVPQAGYFQSLKQVHDRLSSQAVDEALFRNPIFLSRYGIDYVGPIYFNNQKWFYPIMSRNATIKLSEIPLIPANLKIANKIRANVCSSNLGFSSEHFYLPPGSFIFQGKKSLGHGASWSAAKNLSSKITYSYVVDILRHVDGQIVEVRHLRPDATNRSFDFLLENWRGGLIEINVYADASFAGRGQRGCDEVFPLSLSVMAN
jgi:hypothetical protein